MVGYRAAKEPLNSHSIAARSPLDSRSRVALVERLSRLSRPCLVFAMSLLRERTGDRQRRASGRREATEEKAARAREVSSENVLSAGQPRHDADAGRFASPSRNCHVPRAMRVRGARASAQRRKRASAPVRFGGRQIVERRDGDDAAEVRGIMSVRGAGPFRPLALVFF